MEVVRLNFARRLYHGDFKNMKSGEVLGKDAFSRDFTLVAIPKREKVDGWLMIFQDSLIQLAKDKEITLTPRRVLDYLIGLADYDNKIVVSQSFLAEELNLYRPDVSHAISLLLKKGYLEKGPKSGRSFTYRLIPELGYKGRAKSWKRAVSDYRFRMLSKNS